MTDSVAHGGHMFIFKLMVAVSCIIDSWHVLNALSKF